MMICHGKEILGSSTFVQCYKFLRIPILGFPILNYFFKPNFGWMSVMFNKPFILFTAFIIHMPPKPVSLFRLALRPPMRPYSELGILEPFRCFVLLQRL